MTTSLFPALQDKKLYQDAKAIREWLRKLSGCDARRNEDPQPFYGNTTSGLILIEQGGSPVAVGTPFGYWSATWPTIPKNENWLTEASEHLGLTLCLPKFNNASVIYGPVWYITKNLDGELLPTPKADLREQYPVLRGKSYLSSLKLSPKTMRDEIEPRLGAMRIEKTSVFFDGGKKSYRLGSDESNLVLEYNLYKVLWHEMKKDIGYAAWHDRVDDYFPQLCSNQDFLNEHLESMGFSPASLRLGHNMVIFGLSADDEKTDYLIICKEYPCVIRRVICRDLREPTVAEKEMVVKILAARGFVWEASTAD